LVWSGVACDSAAVEHQNPNIEPRWNMSTDPDRAEPLHIVVLGDVHGRLHLAWSLVKRIEAHYRIKVAHVLQVGDLGFWPRPAEVLDRATRRHAAKDPEEISFPEWSQPDRRWGGTRLSPRAEALLAPAAPRGTRVDADLIFIKGNHDDWERLPGLTSGGLPSPVDHYERHRFLPNGGTMRLGDGEGILVGALGGLEHGDPARDGFSNAEAEALAGRRLDLLLTHEPPPRTPPGSRLRRVVESTSPRFVLSGHLHWHERDLWGEVEFVTLSDVRLNERGEVNAGCAGILTWRGVGVPSFEVLGDDFAGAFPGRSILVYPGDDALAATR